MIAKVIDIKLPLKAPAKTDLAATVAQKLEAAQNRLAELEAQVGAAALAQALDPAASKALADLNGRLDTARRDMEQLESAYTVAMEGDARSLAAFEAYSRRADLTKLQCTADARLEAMRNLCAALETAATAYSTFLDLTDTIALEFPTGLIQHHIDWHILDLMIGGRAFPAPIDKIVAHELFRVAPVGDDGQRHVLPGAKPLIEQLRLQPGEVEPATEGVRRMNEYLLELIRDKIDAIERADLERFPKSAEVVARYQRAHTALGLKPPPAQEAIP